MKIIAQDIVTILYETFHKLEMISGPVEPDFLVADKIEIDVYEARLVDAQNEVENILLEGSQLLDRYVDSRIKKIIAKMKYGGELK